MNWLCQHLVHEVPVQTKVICELSLHSLRKGLRANIGIKTWVFDQVCYEEPELKSFSMRDFPFFRRPPRWK